MRTSRHTGPGTMAKLTFFCDQHLHNLAPGTANIKNQAGPNYYMPDGNSCCGPQALRISPGHASRPPELSIAAPDYSVLSFKINTSLCCARRG
eukprot:1079573-Pelagomonas_calceolata.AAC.9